MFPCRCWFPRRVHDWATPVFAAAAAALLGGGVAGAAPLGDVTAVSHDNRSVTLTIGTDKLAVTVCSPSIVRVDYQRNGQTDHETPVLDPKQTWDANVSATVQSDADPVAVRTDRLIVRIGKHPCRVSLYTAAGEQLLTEPADGGVFVDASSDAKGGLRFEHAPRQHFYGVKAFDIAGSEAPANAAARTLLRDGNDVPAHKYQANAATQGGAGAPFIWTTAGYGLLVDSDNGYFVAADPRLEFDYGSPPRDTNGRRYERNNSVCYFLFVGEPKELLADAADVTGHAPMFPKWAMGFTNSQWGITQDSMLTAVDGYRARDIPIDNFTVDFDWKAWGEDNFGEFRWNKAKFPAAAAESGGCDGQPLSAKMNSRGVRMTGIMKPRIVRFLKPDGSGSPTVQGKEADDQHFWIAGVERHKDYQSGLPCGELDFSLPQCRDWFWRHTRDGGGMQAGIAGFWNDEGDEAFLAETGRAIRFNNFEHMQMQQALYEGQRAWQEGGRTVERVWSINRNFYLGAQRVAYAMWSGDIPTGFDSMARQPARMLSAVALGQAKWGMDSGGFYGTPSPENYARWVQFSAMVPIFRVHGSYQEHRQPWVYGEQAEEVAKDAIRLRYRLAPYVYECEREAHERGLGLVRPLMVEFPRDPGSADVTDEWMMGNSLLAAPVLKRQALGEGQPASRSVYLPPGTWVDYFRGDVLEGGHTISYAINAGSWFDMPLFVRRGTIVTSQDVVPSLGAAKPDRLYLDVFPEAAATPATVYDDDGVSYAYEGEGFFKQRVSAKTEEDGVAMNVAAREGKYRTPLRYFVAKIHGRAARAVTLNGDSLTEVTDAGKLFTAEGTWSRGRDVYGDVTLVRIPAAREAEVQVRLTGSNPVETGPETIEAEDGSLSGETPDTRLTTATDRPGFSGGGFAAGFSKIHAGVSMSVKRRTSGAYSVAVRAANAGEAQATLGAYVNGVRHATLSVPKTPGRSAWAEVKLVLPLVAGNNVVALRRDPDDTGAVNVDCIRVPFEPTAGNVP